MRLRRSPPWQVRTMILVGLAAFTAGLWAVALSRAASAPLFGAAPKAGDTLSLSPQDQQTAWNDLSATPNQDGPATFRPSTTSAIPSTLDIHAIKGKAAVDLPALKPYDFAKVQNKLLIINPHDMMIAEVISG
ncbi:MAG TPA: hypothetical protein VMA30_01235 [Xanthobacteraceae bacterium]|nr:hypothetical protein [Xanthobacteraceae bacterium]